MLHIIVYLALCTYLCTKLNDKTMSAIIVLIVCSLSVALTFLVAFIWSVKAGQYDDDYTPSVRMLFDDQIKVTDNTSDNKN